MEKPVKKLKADEIESFKRKLTAMRAQLRGDVHLMTETAMKKNRMDETSEFSSTPIHPAESGSDNFEQEFTLSLMEVGAGRIQEVEAALKRIDEGTYGICEGCGGRIPKKRLEAIPYASKCVQCLQNKK